jgi:thymidylate synthase (FAD)
MAHTHNAQADALLDKEFKVLDHGFVRLVDYMGGDDAIVQAARVSYGEGTKKVSEDRALIRYLFRHRHTSPFEMVELKFHVKLPIFVARQWIRHRTANVNEYSGRYSVMKEEFYLPAADAIRFQAAHNRQGRSDEEVPEEMKQRLIEYLNQSQSDAYRAYRQFIDDNLARELARIGLPLSLYTEWYWKIDLHNLFHFLRLRLDHHAQMEIREYAGVIAEMVRTVCPRAWEAFCDYSLEALFFSGPELKALKKMLGTALDDPNASGLSGREADEFLDKLRRIAKLD